MGKVGLLASDSILPPRVRVVMRLRREEWLASDTSVPVVTLEGGYGSAIASLKRLRSADKRQLVICDSSEEERPR